MEQSTRFCPPYALAIRPLRCHLCPEIRREPAWLSPASCRCRSILRCHPPAVACKRASGGSQLTCISKTPLGGRKVKVKPRKRLRAGTRYTVKLSRDVEDLGANQLPSASRKWSFRTGR